MRSLLGWFLALGLAIAACGSDSDRQVCISGEKVGCTCDDGEPSVSVCNERGTAFSGCQCGDGAGGTSGAGCLSGTRDFCKCPDGSNGIQICLDDGSGYGSCDCNTGGPGGSGTGSSGSPACIPGGSVCQVTDTCCNGGACTPLASGKNVCVQQ